jgi:hypothetical protein
VPRTIHPTRPDPDILELQRALQRANYGRGFQVDGYPSAGLWESVEDFQLQHIGPNGMPLDADGVVGPATWWALENPSGVSQQNGFTLALPPRNAITNSRRKVQDWVVGEYRRGVREIPDGSNRGPEVDGYWGPTGIIGQPWCAVLVSTALRAALGRYPIGQHHISVQAMYRAALELGLITKTPRPWDIFVQIKSGGFGHTGFGSAFSRSGVAATFEGNAGNRLKHGRRQMNTITAWIDPYQDMRDELYQDLPELAELAAASDR